MILARTLRRCWWLLFPALAAAIGFGWRTEAWEQAKNRLTGGPPVIEYPAEIDLGDRTANEIVLSQFQIANCGGQELVISQVKQSCACGRLEREVDGRSELIEELKLAPGERADMVVRTTIRTKSVGTFGQTISFLTNDPKQHEGRINLVFRTASGGVRFNPSAVYFGRILLGQKTRKVVDVFDRDETPQTVMKVISTDPEQLAVRWIPAVKAERRDDELLLGQVEVVPNTSKPLKFDTTVMIEFADPKIETAALQVSGRVTPRIEVSPQSLVLPLASGSGPLYTRNCVVRLADDRPWRLEIESISPGLKVVLPDVAKGSAQVVRITWVPSSEEEPGSIEKTVQLRAKIGDESDRIKILVTCVHN